MIDPEPMLFVKKNCPVCDEVKLILGDLSGISIYDVDDYVGLSEAAFYGLIGKSVPLLLFFKDGNSCIITDPTEIVCLISTSRITFKTCEETVCSI